MVKLYKMRRKAENVEWEISTEKISHHPPMGNVMLLHFLFKIYKRENVGLKKGGLKSVVGTNVFSQQIVEQIPVP